MCQIKLFHNSYPQQALDKDTEKGAKANQQFVKVAVDEPHTHNLPVAVHATERITAQLAVEAGADYLVHSVDDELLSDAFVELLKTHNTVLCPTRCTIF